MGSLILIVAVYPLVLLPLSVSKFAPSRFSRVNVIAGIRGGVRALRAVRTDCAVDGVDHVLWEK